MEIPEGYTYVWELIDSTNVNDWIVFVSEMLPDYSGLFFNDR